MNDQPLKLVVGLGNPGKKYSMTRHNIGFLIADALAFHFHRCFENELFNAQVAEVSFEHLNFLIIKPQTFMNRSGEAVSAMVGHFQIKPADILVIHDDIDLVPGRVKFSSGGGDGGHRGVRSIADFLGCSDFARLKIGIGRPGPAGEGGVEPVEEYVLSEFSQTERQLQQQRLELILQGVTFFLEDGIEKAMNAVNGR
jgi:PTH1 family peptidyl-tRNA hydrolase